MGDLCIEPQEATGPPASLRRQINSFYYERLLSHDVIRDPYVLEFLGLKECKHYLETELEEEKTDDNNNIAPNPVEMASPCL